MCMHRLYELELYGGSVRLYHFLWNKTEILEMENLQEQHVMAIQCVEHEQFCGQWNSDVRNET